MYKVLIADDEPKIRKGLINFIDWSSIDMEIVGEAEDGEIAYDLAKALSPDILLVDICMPFLNGLSFIKKLKALSEDNIIIIITGHDEFNYAKEALQLNVFDYLLKPVPKNQLLTVLQNAKSELTKKRTENKYLKWANTQLKENILYFTENFLNDWLKGSLSDFEIMEQIQFLDLDIRSCDGMIVIRSIDKVTNDENIVEWDRQLLNFAIKNIIEELLEEWTPKYIFNDKNGDIIIILKIINKENWVTICNQFETTINKYLNKYIITAQCEIDMNNLNLSDYYEVLLEKIRASSKLTPIVIIAQKYIENYYLNEQISLNEVAEHANVSPAYLSRLLKQETGLSFIDYLTKVRINKALLLLTNPKQKIYEIAESVGYSSQHYFCTAFKKVLGISPNEYRRGIK